MLLADAMYKDGATGKTVLAGIFDEITIDSKACSFTAPAVLYLSLTDICGEVDLVLRYVDLKTNQVLHEFKTGRVRGEDRLATMEAAIPLHFLPVPHAGVYALELFSGGQLLGSLRLTAHIR
jgi:Family of unknown function (DUF6941)